MGACTSRPCAEGVPTGTLGWQWFDSQAHFVVVMAPTRNEPKVWKNPLTSGLTH